MKKTNVIVAIAIVVCLIIFFWYNSPDQKARRNVKETRKTFERLFE